ncbi:hypothetical protein GCM10008956_05620 [Deinococcus arenae]|uniref:DUF4259 domain-containing protein n=1 Tax=Deinococcus arenae TaxID=1452751 RepID=A0A8H9GJ21_9DEIO|nr:DUF4259 domain-containing protein [Deinococcus arenae]AWT35733.1 hypothetical protein DM785_09305 [Deinococcus actinosclerus]GGM32302.1 hypothetical protein GCM10008956_05620 [Deinococcus arenae]
MSAWGVGPFQNEAAAGYAAEIVQDGAYALAEAFDVALDPDNDYLEAEEGHRAVAAAETLAAVLTGDTSALTDAALRAWVQNTDAAELSHLRPHAMEALERVLGPGSELPDLWEDSEDADAWREDIQRLRAALS